MKEVGESGGRQQEKGLKVFWEKHFTENNLPTDEKSVQRDQKSEIRSQRATCRADDSRLVCE